MNCSACAANLPPLAMFCPRCGTAAAPSMDMDVRDVQLRVMRARADAAETEARRARDAAAYRADALRRADAVARQGSIFMALWIALLLAFFTSAILGSQLRATGALDTLLMLTCFLSLALFVVFLILHLVRASQSRRWRRAGEGRP